MGVSNQTGQPHVASAIGVIKAAAIIEVAATGWMTISLNTIPSRATPILDANEVILDEDPIPKVLLTFIHPDSVLTGLVLHPARLVGVFMNTTSNYPP